MPARAPQRLTYDEVFARYDRRTRAAYEVMGRRWQRFTAAKDAYQALPPRSREWYEAAERAYRLGLRSTHAYYVWTRGHTQVVLTAQRRRGAVGRALISLRPRSA